MDNVGGPHGQGNGPVKSAVEGSRPSPTATKSVQLGMDYGTACHRLRKQVMFRLVQKAGLDGCLRCGLDIESAEDLSLDHREVWLHASPDLFWDLDNVGFSHLVCNTIASRRYRRQPPNPGLSWCSDHKGWTLREQFSPGKTWDGTAVRCRACNARREADRVAQHPRVPCPDCGTYMRKRCSVCGWVMPMKDYMKLRRGEGASY